jgi:DNA-binding response OmpR family regulator
MARIIVLHNDESIREMVCMLLGFAGYTAISRPTTATPLILLPAPDLVLLDIPGNAPASGWAVLDALTRDPSMATIPVLVCSSVPAVLAQAQQRGLPTFAEPFQPADLLSLIAAHLGTKSAPPDA